MSSPLPLRFVRSASDHSQLGPSTVEYAIVGRSNVGKSTLINALAQRRKLARTSKTPGATQLLNVYEHGDEGSGRWLVDLPGYGYAKMSKTQQQVMADMINAYLTERAEVDGAIALFDANVGPTALDLQTVAWLRHIDLPFLLVGTKIDKMKSSARGRQQRAGADKLGVASGEISWVSAESGAGIVELRRRIASELDA